MFSISVSVCLVDILIPSEPWKFHVVDTVSERSRGVTMMCLCVMCLDADKCCISFREIRGGWR